MKTALTIAGSDCSGGAGIQADIKTMTVLGVYAMSAIAALTAQNTMGVFDTLEVGKAFLGEQIDCVFQDIRPDAVKIGMLSSGELINVTAERLRRYEASHIVLDPVMVSTSGCRLMQKDAEAVLCSELIPLAELVTPNIPEAEVLAEMEIHTAAEMEKAARLIRSRYGCNVLLKGGHSVNDANDLLCCKDSLTWLRGSRIDNPNTHGTGCTLSSAIAAELALGNPLEEAVKRAKEFLTGAIRAGLDLGRGAGPLNHAYRITGDQ